MKYTFFKFILIIYYILVAPKKNFNFVDIESSQSFSDFGTLQNTLDLHLVSLYEPFTRHDDLCVLENLGECR
jgi:hypothetical protein